MTYEVEKGRYGPRLVLVGEWDDAVRATLRPDGVRELMLNYARGWTGRDLSFLRSLPFLDGLVVINRTLDDDSAVESVRALRHLQLSTYCSNPLDFSMLPNLEDCAITWRRGIKGLFEKGSLRQLYMVDFPSKNLEAFSALARLERLSLSGGKLATTAGLDALVSLTQLGLFHLRHLRMLDGLEQLAQLRILEFERCVGIGDIDALASLHSLQRLRIDDCGPIQSLRPLHHSNELRELFFVGSTNVVDGSLDVLLGLPHLRDVSFRNRQHYSHTREELARALRDKSTS